MGGRTLSDERETRDGRVHGDGDLGADFDARGRDGIYDGGGGRRSLRVELVWGGEDLGVVVVGGTGAAHAAAAADDRGVREEEADAVVVARDGGRVEGGEFEGGGVPQLGVEDGRVVGKRLRVCLAADNQDLTVGKDDAVVKSSGVGHRTNRCDCGLRSGRAYGDDMRVGRCIRA